MNTKTISGNLAASLTHLNWPEDWVTGRVIMQRFGFCERTLRKYVEHGLTKHLIGKRQMRFVVREVYEWLLKEGAVRFAAIGLRSISREQQPDAPMDAKASFTVPVPAGMTVVEPAQSPELDTRHSSLATGDIAPPRCKPGRKPKNPPKRKVRCLKGRHRWRLTAYHRTCADCGHVEDRDATQP